MEGGARARTPSREGHSFHVSRIGKTSYALARERPIYPEPSETILRWGNRWENETSNRRQTLAANGHLCVHTIGPSGLFGLGHSFQVSQPGAARMLTGKTGAFVLVKQLPSGNQRYKSTHRLTLRAQPFRQITEKDALIRWLGGLQGWRTAVHDVKTQRRITPTFTKERGGLLGKNLLASTRGRGWGEGR